jgi:S-adenosylmethionine hydrolase
VAVDVFGNLITNLSEADLLSEVAEPGVIPEVRIGGHVLVGLARTYGMVEEGKLLALIGSCGCLEIAVANGSAAQMIRGQVGDAVTVHWPKFES